jgi:hypothetical protein
VKPGLPIAVALALLELGAPFESSAFASSRFEPTDLELEDPGVVDLDVQLGTFRGSPRRALVTDWEIDLGLAANVELDVDGAVSWIGDGRLHRAWDPLWISSKLGLYESHDPSAKTAWALGLQIGPRVALDRPQGLGYEALALVGRTVRATTVVVNAGFMADARAADAPRALALELGADLTHAFSPRWALLGELAIQRFLTSDPHHLEATLGLARTTPWLDVSLIGFVGLLTPGDRFGVLLGVSPKLRLFGG